MRTYILLSALALAFFVPVFAHGAVIINEIAWMGTVVSATDEWIELFNDGAEDVSLAGWKILADDGAPSITLSGTIPAGGFYLLERTDDESVPTISADKIYTGDLSNSGETLKLLGSGGTTIDTLTGGAGWENIGGNNISKDTPQRQSDGAWLTGVPTPKALNTTIASIPPESGTIAGTSTTKTTTRKRTISGGYKQIVFGYAGEDTAGVAGAPIVFEGFAVTDGNVPIRKATYRWTFGDGGQGKGKEVLHTYEEPGFYTVVLNVIGKYQKWQDKITVSVGSANVAISGVKEGEEGFIELSNNMETELELSGWKLSVTDADKDTAEIFIIPQDTFIAPKSSVRFSATITGLLLREGEGAMLKYPNGKVAAKSS